MKEQFNPGLAAMGFAAIGFAAREWA